MTGLTRCYKTAVFYIFKYKSVTAPAHCCAWKLERVFLLHICKYIIWLTTWKRILDDHAECGDVIAPYLFVQLLGMTASIDVAQCKELIKIYIHKIKEYFCNTK